MSTYRSGLRRLDHPLNRTCLRGQDRSLDDFAIRLSVGRRPPPINWLRAANRTLRQYIRMRVASLKRWPEESPLDMWHRLKREREEAARSQKLELALARVYGTVTSAERRS